MAPRKVSQDAQQAGSKKDASNPNMSNGKKPLVKGRAVTNGFPETPTQTRRTSPRKCYSSETVASPATTQKRPAPIDITIEPEQHLPKKRLTKKRNVSESLGDTETATYHVQAFLEIYEDKDECLQNSEKQRADAVSLCEEYRKTVAEKDKEIDRFQQAAAWNRVYCEEIEGDNNKLQQEKSHLQEENEHLQEKIQGLREIIIISNERLAKLRVEKNRFERENKHLDGDIRCIQGLLEKCEQKLATHEITYTAVTDDEVHKKWWQVHSIMYSMVNNLFTVDPAPQDIPEFENQDSIVHLAKECLDRPLLRPLILQQYIWSQLLVDVFRGGVGVWGGELGQRLVGMVMEFADQCALDPAKGPTLSEAKYTCVHKLSDVLEINKEAIRIIVDNLKKHLSCFFTNKSQDEVDERLTKVVSKAVDLHIILMKSRSLFRFIYTEPFPDQSFSAYIDRDAMYVLEMNMSEERQGMYFVSTPALEKFGHTNGYEDSFGKREMVVQSRVYVD